MIIGQIYPVGLWSAPQLFFRLSGEESAKDLEICVAQVGFRINIIIINIIIIIITRSYAALRAADLEWIVGPGYSLGGYILEKNHEKPTWNHEKP